MFRHLLGHLGASEKTDLRAIYISVHCGIKMLTDCITGI